MEVLCPFGRRGCGSADTARMQPIMYFVNYARYS